MDQKLLVIDIAAMGYDFLRENDKLDLNGLSFKPTQTIFPALTCPVQASFRTASNPSDHGMIANGLYFKPLSRIMFWEQSSKLVTGKRIWDSFASRGGTVGMMFWQQSLGESADLILSPLPIHKHHGGMIQHCHSRPSDLYQKLCRRIGKFKLRHYWGPLASTKSGDWIANAASEVLADKTLAPDLLMLYLPTLDYDLQRYGPNHKRSSQALNALFDQLAMLVISARKENYEIVMFGDYAISPTSGEAIYPNRALADAGKFITRRVRKMLYPNFPRSQAVAMVDHEIAHVYISDDSAINEIGDIFSELPGVQSVKRGAELSASAIGHPNSGQLVLTADEGRWFAYPWWRDAVEAPDYAGNIDIHNKPGFDPCELFFGWPPTRISSDTARVRGSHGSNGSTNRDKKVAWASTIKMGKPASLVDLASKVGDWLDEAK